MKNSTENLLSVQNLYKSYGSLKAVQNLSFQVSKGEIFGLLGPNGTGKSTTLECILGTRSFENGMIELLKSQPANSSGKVFNRVGVQFQNSRYPDHIKVKELCQMFWVLYKDCYDWNILLEDFGLKTKANTMVSDLSGGEKQKLSLLLALLNKPEIVFLDELTTGLDPMARRLVWSHLKKLKDQGMTIVLTSHYMEEVQHLCDRILIMKKGKEIISGTPENVISKSGKENMDEAYLFFCGEEEINEETVTAI